MALPSTRVEFKKYCLRKLGAPLIEINVSDEQVEDRIDDALAYYAEYHFDGSHKVYIPHQITDADKVNKYITISDDIIGITSIFTLSGSLMSTGMFSPTYQMTLDAINNISSGGLTSYYSLRQNMALMEEILIGQVPVRYNRHMDKLYVDTKWSNLTTGNYIIIDGYMKTKPEDYPDVWKDKWLLRYATELIREQMGINLTKFNNVQMPGGMSYNGQGILDMARENLKALEEEMISSYSLPAMDFVG